ncbi:MAG TPA: alpha-ketoacid dehydrogenase subunit beta [Spirochaetia bacterium]|nr:alpha-ketoacid dehydrogenase subunit beta [Spirochaetales bacterium]HRY79290.1 alpha-ketoacid dehydrogenase subunit beta [Spirochaetia bacterium]
MREMTYAEAIREALSEEMRRDESVFFIGEDIGVYGGAFGVSKGMLAEFGPKRVRDTPISETAIVGCGVGAAMAGLRPVVEIMFSDFVAVAMDQIVNQAAKARFQFGGQFSVPLVIRTPSGSGTGAAEQHSQSLEAWFVHTPGIKVAVPSTPADAKGLLISAIRDPNPVLFLEQKLLYRTKGEVPEGDYTVPFGQAAVRREGRDVAVITYGRMVARCLEAAQAAAAEGIEAEVLDLRTLAPMDREAIIRTVKKCGRVLIVHEACRTGGVGGEIAATIADSEAFFWLDAPVRRLCGEDTPIPYNRNLEDSIVPRVPGITEEILRLARREASWPRA